MDTATPTEEQGETKRARARKIREPDRTAKRLGLVVKGIAAGDRKDCTTYKGSGLVDTWVVESNS